MEMEGPVGILDLTVLNKVLCAAAVHYVDGIPVTSSLIFFCRPENDRPFQGPFRDQQPLYQQTVLTDAVSICVLLLELHYCARGHYQSHLLRHPYYSINLYVSPPDGVSQ